MLELRIVSSLAKVYLDKPLDLEYEISSGTMLSNDRYHFQVAYRVKPDKCSIKYKCESELGDAVSLRYVDYVPCDFPCFRHGLDTCEHPEPGVLPDILGPMPKHPWAYRDSWRAVWVTVDGSKKPIKPGKYPITITLADSEEAKAVFELEVLPGVIPEQKLPVTNWLHCDCICNYYNVEFASDEFWRLAGTYIETSVRNNSNMILTPIFTPPLDTEVGGERRTAQLIDVTVRNGKYSFGFDKLDKWIDMCLSLGVKYLEMSHLFTQWGCKFAPKVMATVDGEYKRIFGWDTDGHGEEYHTFLGELLPKLTEFLKAKGVYDRCFFHLSDEPELEMMEDYRKSSEFVRQYIPLEKIIDALSRIEYCKEGLIKNPVVSVGHVPEFVKEGVDTAWCYYCLGPLDTTNRFIAWASYRTRVLGLMMFKHDMKGFLHWGLNFYNTWQSCEAIDPYMSSTAQGWSPGGDPFVVYPSKNGGDIESLRLCVFSDAIKDFLIMDALLERYSREELLKRFGIEDMTFKTFLKPSRLLAIREELNRMLSEMQK